LLYEKELGNTPYRRDPNVAPPIAAKWSECITLPFRQTPENIARLKARNATGEMVPIGSVATFKDETAPYRVPRYNLYPAAEIMGAAAPGVASGTALERMIGDW
jgi:hypothetical protein